MIRNLLALTGLLALALGSAIALQAYGYFDDDRDPPPRLAVSYAGLDLATPEGVRLLEDRINIAIDRVCPGDDPKSVKRYQSIRACREDAIASVRPQLDRAIAAAEDGERYASREMAFADEPAPQMPGWTRPAAPPQMPDWTAPRQVLPRPPAAEGRPADTSSATDPHLRLIRRTVVTRTVTTTRGGQPGLVDRVSDAVARPSLRKPTGHRHAAYVRHQSAPGSWLPPVAWRAIEQATARAFTTGRLVRWIASDGRSRAGYVTVSAARRVDGCRCRNVRVVKYDGGRQLVVAEGLRCRVGSGRGRY